MSLYTHLTIKERELSMVLLSKGWNKSQIAKKLGRDRSTIGRELKRNSNKDGSYSANTAQKRYQHRRKACGRKPLLQTNKVLRDYVIARLLLFWSPEQIAGRSKLENNGFQISYGPIYRAIAAGIIPKQMRLCLRIKRKRNRKRNKDDKRGKIADRISIHDRPEIIKMRSEVGHWESDTVQGKRGTGCIGTHVERVSGFLTAFKAKEWSSETFNEETVKLFEFLPSVLKKSFTVDNGKEFTLHKELTAQTGMTVYFCDPHCPWQRGTNENTNGLLRQYFPKGSSFAEITDERLAEVVDLINNRPRKRLNYRTPAEVLDEWFRFCCT